MIKHILSFITLSKGGINFLSKNFEVTMILRNLLIQATEDILTAPETNLLVREENLFPVRLLANHNNIALSKSLYENPLFSQANNILVKMNTSLNVNNDLLIKSNLLQLRYLLELSFMVNFKSNLVFNKI